MASAVSINRAILRNASMAQRRSLFEVLGIFTYVIAVVLSVFSILNWTSQPYFVASCTAIWVLFSLGVVTRLWWGNHNEKVLEIPDAWYEPVGKYQEKQRIALECHATTAEFDSVDGVQADPSLPQSDTGTQAAAISDSSTAEPAHTRITAIDTQAARTSKNGLRTVRLQQYRQERFSRYRQKRRSRRVVAGNLAIYWKQSGICTSNGNDTLQPVMRIASERIGQSGTVRKNRAQP